MRFLISFILFIISVPSFSSEFTINGNRKIFANVAIAEGHYSVDRPYLTVLFPKLLISRNSERNDSSLIKSVSVGIANDSTGRWKVERWGESYEINKLLRPGATYNVKDYASMIPIDGIKDLSSYWFVIRIKSNDRGSTGYTFSHSGRVFVDQ